MSAINSVVISSPIFGWDWRVDKGTDIRVGWASTRTSAIDAATATARSIKSALNPKGSV